MDEREPTAAVLAPPASRRSVEHVGTPSGRPERKVTVASQLFQVLREYGVETVFGNPGGAMKGRPIPSPE